MPKITVPLEDIADQLEISGDEWLQLLNMKTGKLISLLQEHLDFAEKLDSGGSIEDRP